ncbi:MAG: hypothetical protein HC934_00760 [Acaryochloridaceae cyanobacterium SU_2_1]|nr:hypothetical protein [Acaryochloridaceae cyanobacterium SU_2_1]
MIPFSQTISIRPKPTFLAFGLLGALLLASCDNSKSSPSSSPTPTAQTANTQAPQTSPPETSNSPAADVNLADIVGTAEDGWLPKAIAQYPFKRDMKPEAVGKLVPGAEKISEFGISEVAVQDIPGIEKFKFSFFRSGKGS